MTRTLTLVISPHKDGGLALTVTNKSTEGDSDASETHVTKARDGWASNKALQDAAANAMKEYFAQIREDRPETPIEAAAR